MGARRLTSALRSANRSVGGPRPVSLAALGTFFEDSAVLFGLLVLPLGLVLQLWLSLALRAALRVCPCFLDFQFLEWLPVGFVLLLR